MLQHRGMLAKEGARQDAGGVEMEAKPEWIRPRQVTALFGIGRGLANQLIAEGRIKSVSLCQPGRKRGTRLVSYASVRDYLEGLATAQQARQAGNPVEGGAI
ncbi:hypothetical protein [Luteolibacter sp. Populi]|uniref:hypothetical protein n=1 Tax=Luteolibacter sp. Populi TaxID=3230487 RepID=UPI003466CCCB